VTATFWDKRASKYDEVVRAHDDDFEQVLSWTKPLLNSTDVVLDFGCASGEYSLALADCVNRVHGIDTSEQMIALAQRKKDERRVLNASFDQVDEFSGSLDGDGFTTVVAFDVLHLVDDAAVTLARLRELVGTGGRLISTTPCLGEWQPFVRLLIQLAQKVGLAPRIAPFTLPKLESVVTAAGFRIQEVRTAIPKTATRWIVATAR